MSRFDSDNLHTATFLPHDGAENHRYRSDFGYDPTGRLIGIDHAYDFTHSPDPDDPDYDPQARTTHVAYERFASGWIRSSSDERDIAPGEQKPFDQQIRYGYDPRGFQSSWQTDGFIAGRDSARRITRESYPSGAMFERRGVKLIADGSERQNQARRRPGSRHCRNRPPLLLALRRSLRPPPRPGLVRGPIDSDLRL